MVLAYLNTVRRLSRDPDLLRAVDETERLWRDELKKDEQLE